ncbi:MAG: BON domain-containing protein [Planctomycetales bacterium]|nr:BON domain-containing protein [Planctomycetales bacterium]
MRRFKNAHALIVAAAMLIGVGVFALPDRLGDADELRARVVETLRAIVDVDTGKIEVSVENGDVTLSGALADHADRQIIVEEVKNIDGVERVIDEMIDVEADNPPDEPGSQ